MHIAIDARAYSWTGIGQYTRNLIRELLTIPSSHRFSVLLAKEDYSKFEGEYRYHPRLTTKIVEGSYYSLKEQTIFWQQLESVKADLFHFTHFNLPLLFSKPYVVTIHDATRFIFSGQRQQDFLHQLAYEWVFKRAVERAQAVICASQATADELRHLPLQLPPRLRTTHEGIDDVFRQQVSSVQREHIRSFLKTNEPYLLFVGVWMNHKNLERLLYAFQLIKPHYPALKLVITGKPQQGYVDVPSLAAHYNVQHSVILPGFVEASLLPALYAEAILFVFPSLYEGFGLPPLEAAACGTAVICSNVSSLPEVMQGAAWYVNPDSGDDIAETLLLLLSNENKRKKLISDASKHVANFQWKRTAEQTLEVYEECAKIERT